MDKSAGRSESEFDGEGTWEDDSPARDPVEVFEKGMEHYQEKYFRTAFMIAKGAAGFAGINDQIPDMDDLQRMRTYYEEVRHAYETFQREGTDEKWQRILRRLTPALLQPRCPAP